MSRFLRGPHLKNKECENDDTCYVEDYSWIYPYITILCKYIIFTLNMKNRIQNTVEPPNKGHYETNDLLLVGRSSISWR